MQLFFPSYFSAFDGFDRCNGIVLSGFSIVAIKSFLVIPTYYYMGRESFLAIYVLLYYRGIISYFSLLHIGIKWFSAD